jgi:plasmid stabilization system protein ParE
VSRFVVRAVPEAEHEFREAFFWYFERSPIAADAFRSLVFEAIDGLADRADMWPVDEDGFHFCVLTRFPYTIWYDVAGTTVSVLAVAHQHRRPNYWKLRAG